METLALVASPPSLAVVLLPGKGRGVVALRPFSCGELVERAPVLPFPARDVAPLAATALCRYYYEWGPDADEGAIVLGYGSLYNHAFEPNLAYEFREEMLCIDYLARRAIEPGEELTVNYNNLGPRAAEPLAFEVR